MANQAPRMRTCTPTKCARAGVVLISGQYGAMRWPIRSPLGFVDEREFLAHESTHVSTSKYTWYAVLYFLVNISVRY